MKTKESIVNLVASINDLDLSDKEEDTDDEAIQNTTAYMVRSRVALDPPTALDPPANNVISVRAHFEYTIHPFYKDRIYAISDGGADSCILGKYAKVLSHTGRFANLIGYDPNTTKTERVPIVTALIKARSSSTGQLPILLKVHEAQYNPQSPITLLSEYQI